MGKWIRPKVDEDLLNEIRDKYPQTLEMNDKETVAWALKTFLAIEFETEPIGGRD